MPGPIKIDLTEMNILMSKGMSSRKIAKHFGVSPSAITFAKKKLNAGVVRGAAGDHGGQ